MKRAIAILSPLALWAQTSTVIIVPADLVPAANQAATHFDPEGGTNTFTSQLVTAGTTNIWGCWAATPFRATNRVALSYMASQPPFATNGVTRLIIGDYDLAADPGAPFRLLETNGLAPYSPPMFAP